MTRVRMHVDEVPTDSELVRRLLAAQLPQWAGLPLAPIPSAGTDNTIYRLGACCLATRTDCSGRRRPDSWGGTCA